MRRNNRLTEQQIRHRVMREVYDFLNEHFPADDIEQQALDKVRKLGEFGIIKIKYAPAKFNGYLEIENNIYNNYYVVGWNFNYGCPRNAQRFRNPEGVIKFLKDNGIDLSSLVETVNPDLTNGL